MEIVQVNSNLYDFLKPLIYKLDPESTHNNFMNLFYLTEKIFSLGNITATPKNKNPIKIFGLEFKNRVGLAAGLDKNASHIDALSWLGFGAIEVGTVTPQPQSGNPKPRLFRLEQDKALINRFGFNNVGLEKFIKNIRRSKWVKRKEGILGVNLGMNYNTNLEKAFEDYCIGIKTTYDFADYLVVNISSPNTQDLRSLQKREYFSNLLKSIKKQQKTENLRTNSWKPIFLKMSPDVDCKNLEEMIDEIKFHEIEGIIATNTSVERNNLKEKEISIETGGLSGKPISEKANQILSQIKSYLPNETLIIGSGGVMDGLDACEKIKRGADLIQIYTGLIYSGPKIVNDCISMISEQLSNNQVHQPCNSVSSLKS